MSVNDAETAERILMEFGIQGMSFLSFIQNSEASSYSSLDENMLDIVWNCTPALFDYLLMLK